MILTTVGSLKQYKGINSLLDYLINLLTSVGFSEFNRPVTQIGQNKDIHVLRTTSIGQEIDHLSFKSFDKTITMYIILEGNETIGFYPYSNDVDYNNKTEFVENGICEYTGIADYAKYFVLSKNDIAIFMEDEIHMTDLKYDDNEVTKLTFKIYY